MQSDGVNAAASQAQRRLPIPQAATVSVSDGTGADRPAQATLSLYRWAKRALDIAIALLLVAVFLPIMALVAVLVRVTSPGSIIFRQERIGKEGRPFTMYKFRSMRADADPRAHQEAIERYIRGEDLSASNPNVRYKLVRDPRITRVGAVLRKTSIDELPQLFNVIRGEMSLVGPRPALRYEIAHYPADALVRLSVPQGLTGLWQIRGRGRATWEEALALDIEYAQRCSFVLDCKILLLTIPAMLRAVGAA